MFIALLAGCTLAAVPAAAQVVPAPPSLPRVQTQVETLMQDASEYARQNGVDLGEAMSRLRAQEESVAATDRLRETYGDRLAGIAIEHHPVYRIVVLLTGSEPVADQAVLAGGRSVPIIFQLGAAATRDQVVAAIRQHQAAVRAAFPRSSGMGHDPRTGELVLLVKPEALAPEGVMAMTEQLAAITAVPSRVRLLPGADADLSLAGGARLTGIEPANGRRYACTTGFAVTDGARAGIVTAAHCPDTLTYSHPEGGQVALDFVGQWGARYQDVQIHLSPEAPTPHFYADTDKTQLRRLTSWRNRTSTRAGDAVCRRGETTGYSCSLVELVDYAPPGDLCGGPCEPMWVTVAGPSCRAGDSGGPVFNGGVAFGIVKGGNYNREGACNFYYYMSTDYLPEGWSLLYR